MDLDKNYEKDFEHLWERLYMYTGSRRCIIFDAARDTGLGEVTIGRQQSGKSREKIEEFV